MIDQFEYPAKNWETWFHQSPQTEVIPHHTAQQCHKYWPENGMGGGTIHCPAHIVLLYQTSFNFKHQ